MAGDLAGLIAELDALQRRLDALRDSALATARGQRAASPGRDWRRLRAQELAAALRQCGENERDIARLVAMRLGITTRHARRLLGREARRETGPLSLWA